MDRRTCLRWLLASSGIGSLIGRAAGADSDPDSAPAGNPTPVAVPLQTGSGAVYNPTVLGPGITAGWILAQRGVLSRLETAGFLPGMKRIKSEDVAEVLERGSPFRNAPWFEVAKSQETRLRRSDYALVWIDSIAQFARAFEGVEEPAPTADSSLSESLRRNEPWPGPRPGSKVAVTRTGEIWARRDGVVGFFLACAGVEIQVVTRGEMTISLSGQGGRAVISANRGPG
jgi:hypothetical protein